METNWAVEQLQTIRTLMERSAVYRRTLAPIMMLVGGVGTAAAVLGWSFEIDTPRYFILYWAGVAAAAMVGSFLLVRRQALKAAEPFWSPPTRRITQAFLPPVVAGCAISAALFANTEPGPHGIVSALIMNWLPLSWIVLYGCAFHAAGFFMPRGMKIFGWAFILGGCVLFAASFLNGADLIGYAHGVMGFFFGVLHLAYGFYLFLTEKRRNET
jgi:hypothetical protein